MRYELFLGDEDKLDELETSWDVELVGKMLDDDGDDTPPLGGV